MTRIGKGQSCYAMSTSHAPVAEVGQGDLFLVETEDCYSGRLRTPQDRFTKDLWDTVNPATGPIAIRGVRPGALLRVEVVEIRTRDFAVMCLEHGAGALGRQVEGIETSILPIRGGRLWLNDALGIPLRPMIGVIGTAPAGGSVLNGTPGEHGGNMDCKEIGAGTHLYLPVCVPGALLSLGDLHAVMGDGEVGLCGAEVSGEVLLRAAQVDWPLPTPCLETSTQLSFIASAETLDACEGLVLDKAHRFLTGIEGLAANEAVRWMSLLGDLQVCQVVDPLKTMRFTLPKMPLRRFGALTR
jgi:amidase